MKCTGSKEQTEEGTGNAMALNEQLNEVAKKLRQWILSLAGNLGVWLCDHCYPRRVTKSELGWMQQDCRAVMAYMEMHGENSESTRQWLVKRIGLDQVKRDPTFSQTRGSA
jgi:hypothetical protein